MLKANKGKALVAAMVGLSLLGGMPVAAFAENSANVSGTQAYDSKTTAWTGDATDGKIHITYDTTGGKWQDSGADATVDTDNAEHDNGTYVVTLPTQISYSNMAIGTVNTSDTYDVNVKGALPTGGKVTLSAETGQALSTAKGDGGLTETTTQNKTEWSADEAFGHLNEDGGLSGTTAQDTIAISGVAKTAGSYQGTVAYTSTLS